MLHLYVADVGDGLAAGIWTIGGSAIQIDCGSQQSSSGACLDALRRIQPDSFFLSHFHADHYSGLFGVEPDEKFDIAHVYFPVLPVFPERREFMLAELSISYYILGAASGSQEADFLTQIRSITRVKRPTYKRLSAGDAIDIRGSHFEVLWPPKSLDEESALAKVKNAVKEFGNALKQDEKLQRLHKKIQEGSVVDYYLREDPEPIVPESTELANDMKRLVPLEELPEPVRRANDLLRDAANHMSLALYEDNRLLFLGDLEGHELKRIAKFLLEKHRTSFLATITPHHGTHWHRDLNQIKTTYAVSSVGKRLIRGFRPEIKQCSVRSLSTHSNGDIHVPAHNWGYPNLVFCANHL